jgi:hypothetical protein
VHVQRLLSVVKMLTVLEVCSTEAQRSVVHFLWAKDIHKVVHSWVGKCDISLMTKRLKRWCGSG